MTFPNCFLVVNPILFLQYQPQIPFGQSCIALQKIISENIAGLIVADFSLIVGNIPRTIYKKNKKLSFSKKLRHFTSPTYNKTCKSFQNYLFSKLFVNGHASTRRTAENMQDRKLCSNI